MAEFIDKILAKVDKENLLESLGSRLPGSEFNSLLLEVFKNRAATITPAGLLHAFENNRFVSVSDVDVIAAKELELQWLKESLRDGFKPVTLSPLTPLGTCSSMATVHQHKVVSALRGTEVVADATNVLALVLASDFKNDIRHEVIQRYCTVHRHVRSQHFDNPAFSAHFSIFCLASGGFDRGNFSFEFSELKQALSVLLRLLTSSIPGCLPEIHFYVKTDSNSFQEKLNRLASDLGQPFEIKFQPDNSYYETLQFKIFLRKDQTMIDMADGGFVNWTQQLLGNQKHRMLIAGVGIDLIHRLFSGSR